MLSCTARSVITSLNRRGTGIILHELMMDDGRPKIESRNLLTIINRPSSIIDYPSDCQPSPISDRLLRTGGMVKGTIVGGVVAGGVVLPLGGVTDGGGD